MPSTTYENGRPVDHFTVVPNELINHTSLTPAEKLVLIKHLSEGFKTKTRPDSERKASRRLGVSRKTYSGATSQLVKLGLLQADGTGGPRRQETYRVHLERLGGLSVACSTGSNEVPVRTRRKLQTGSKVSQATGSIEVPDLSQLAQIRATAEEQRKPNEEDGSAAPEGSSLTRASAVSEANGIADDDFDFGLVSSADSAASPREPSHSLDKGPHEPEASESASSGPQHVASTSVLPTRSFTKAEINAAFIRPDGYRVSSDFDDLTYDLNVTLAEAHGQMLNKGDVDIARLVERHGIERCALWAHWLLRKIADEYSKGRPVKSPTGLYRRAVEGEWQVDPNWPEFDELLHTTTAAAEEKKRKAERIVYSASPLKTYTTKEISTLAEAVNEGHLKTSTLPASVQSRVAAECNRLREVDDGIDHLLFGKPLTTSEDSFEW